MAPHMTTSTRFGCADQQSRDGQPVWRGRKTVTLLTKPHVIQKTNDLYRYVVKESGTYVVHRVPEKGDQPCFYENATSIHVPEGARVPVWYRAGEHLLLVTVTVPMW